MKNIITLSRLVFTSSILFFAQACFSQIDLNKKLRSDPKVRVGKLANGLTYYIRKNIKPVKKVQLRLVVNAGSVLEYPDQQGLARMMEHTNFNGSSHFKKNELVDYLQSIGVQFGADRNAYTDFDETVYILPIPSDDPGKLERDKSSLLNQAQTEYDDRNKMESRRLVQKFVNNP